MNSYVLTYGKTGRKAMMTRLGTAFGERIKLLVYHLTVAFADVSRRMPEFDAQCAQPAYLRSCAALYLVWASLLILSFPAAAQDAPRNVVFILSDDHRYDMMGFHAEAPDFLETPNMDRMAREGMHFTNAFVSTSLCSPSRASILTGQYAHRHRVVDNIHPVPEGTVFFPMRLQEEGYSTAFVGKWHMGHGNDEPRPGFDHWISYKGQGTYFDPLLNINGERVRREGYTADIVTDYALEWMEEQRTSDRPFFIYLSHKSVHGWFEAAERHAGLYADVERDYPRSMHPDVAGKGTWPEWVREQRSSFVGVDYMYYGRLDFDTFYQRYAETVLGLDESIGRVLDFLETSGLADNTLVVYMSDNGFSFGEHGLIDKRHAFDESMRVPLLAWAPGYLEPGTRREEMVQNVDIAPTLLALAGSAMPEGHPVDGRSFLPLMRGEDIPWRDDVFYEYYWEYTFPQIPTQFALRSDRYKYVFYYGLWDRNGFYDLQEDPHEIHNRIKDETYEERMLQHRERLFDVLETTAGMHIPLRRPYGIQFDAERPEDEPSTDPFVEEGK